jgi:hypothetical protein
MPGAPDHDTRAHRAASPQSDLSIAARQNAHWGIDLLAAQRQLYMEAKRWRGGSRDRDDRGNRHHHPGARLAQIRRPVGAAAAVIQWLASLIEKHRIKATVQEHVDRAEQRRVNG